MRSGYSAFMNVPLLVRDTAERAVSTVVVVAVAMWLCGGPGEGLLVSVPEEVRIAALTAALTFLKGGVASRVGNPYSASLDKDV